MKVISFFSAKGGTGKTTFNVLLASYIKYKLGKRVMVLDFDFPEYNLGFMRERDLRYMEREGILFEETDLYAVEKVPKMSARSLDTLSKTFGNLSDELDYLILDFPGSFAAEDPATQLMAEGYIDLMVIPVELDPMIIASMLTLSRILKEYGQRSLLFFNRVYGREPKEAYQRVREWFGEEGFHLSEHFVKQSTSLKKEMDEKSHVRSTVHFPAGYANRQNPGIVKLFDELLEYVQKEEKTEGNA